LDLLITNDNVKISCLLTGIALVWAAPAVAQTDSPYARFGYEGRVLRTPQERPLLLVPNPDTAAAVAKIGLDPAAQQYYLFGKDNQVLKADTLTGTTIARFLSVDPLTKKYPELTPYQFASDTPIRAVDLDGLEAAMVNYGYRVTALLVTGSVGIGAGVDIHGDVKVFRQWSAGPAFGGYAGGGLSYSIYPTASMAQVMGGGLNLGGNVGIPVVSFGLDINASLQTHAEGQAQQLDGVKLGYTGGLKLFSLGPGGIETHFDYSETTPMLEFNLQQIPSALSGFLQQNFNLTEVQAQNFVSSIKLASADLTKAAGATTSPPPKTTAKPSPASPALKKSAPAPSKSKKPS
jgi:hypothetical protein